LEDIDSCIAECETYLELFRRKRIPNNLERRRQLERQLMELRRQRRQEAVMSWRDLFSLKREIRALKREIDFLGRTASSAKNREAPT